MHILMNSFLHDQEGGNQFMRCGTSTIFLPKGSLAVHVVLFLLFLYPLANFDLFMNKAKESPSDGSWNPFFSLGS